MFSLFLVTGSIMPSTLRIPPSPSPCCTSCQHHSTAWPTPLCSAWTGIGVVYWALPACRYSSFTHPQPNEHANVLTWCLQHLLLAPTTSTAETNWEVILLHVFGHKPKYWSNQKFNGMVVQPSWGRHNCLTDLMTTVCQRFLWNKQQNFQL